MKSNFKIAQITPLLLLSACTANWDRVVQYSPEPADHSVLVEVYRAVLVPLKEEPGPDSVAMENFGYPARLDQPTSCGGSDVPNHWADTLKHEVRVALSDANCSRLADSADITRAAQTLGLFLLPADVTDWPLNPNRAPPPRAKLSRPGFNRDSTIAAIRLDVSCGPSCGSGETLLLARKPGKRWRVWHSFLHWVS
jgi:hypothetical protein